MDALDITKLFQMSHIIFISSAFLFFTQVCNADDNNLDVKLIERKMSQASGLSGETPNMLQGIFTFIQENELSEDFPLVEKYLIFSYFEGRFFGSGEGSGDE